MLRDVVCRPRASKPPLGTPRKIGQGCTFYSFTTNTYKMHFLESPSGIKVGSSCSMCPLPRPVDDNQAVECHAGAGCWPLIVHSDSQVYTSQALLTSGPVQRGLAVTVGQWAEEELRAMHADSQRLALAAAGAVRAALCGNARSIPCTLRRPVTAADGAQHQPRCG